MRVVTLLLFASVLSNCSLCRSYCEEHPVTKYEYLEPLTGCLATPPPVEQPVVVTSGVECPSQFSGCLRIDEGLALDHNIRAYRRYVKEVWARCAVLVDGGVPSIPTTLVPKIEE